MNPPHLRVQLLDSDAEEWLQDGPHAHTTNKLFDSIDHNLNNLYNTAFAPAALAATLTTVISSNGRLI
jgi:hypothetical protein